MVQLERNGRDSAYHYATEVQLKNGEHAFRIKTQEATIHELRGDAILSHLDKTKLRDQVGSLSRELVFYKGQVEVTRNIGSKAHDSIIYVSVAANLPVKQVDLKVFDWSNTWLRLHEVYNPITDSLNRKYAYRVGFQLTAYRKSQGLFKRSQLVTDLTFEDPAIQVGEFSGVIVKEPRKRWYETRGFAIGLGVIGGVWLGRR